jgi:hypothetical protein
MSNNKEISAADLDLARSLRASNMPWRDVGKRLGCACETIRRKLDPEFNAHCFLRRVERRHREALLNNSLVGVVIKKPAPDDQSDTRYNAHRRADIAFQLSMKRAIASGEETASIGIDKRPSSPDARYTPSRGLALSSGSVMGSSAGMCAES